MRQLKITKSITNRESQSLEKYLQEISKISMITPEEETTLAQKIHMGDQRALEKLVKSNLRFVVSVAKQYQHQGLSLSDLINEASKIPVGSDGLLFLPYLLGERAPIWNANARGLYFGLNMQHSRQHFIRATIEGILYEIYSIGKTLEEHRAIHTLSINGSFTVPSNTQLTIKNGGGWTGGAML